tara:strand:- start:13913 stop:14398 length:486 start_codon:yes stop_codon:yes gene_type:complete
MDNKIIKLNNNSENRSIIENLNIDDSYYDSITQSQIIIDGDNNNDVYKKILKQIQSKINGYKNQDKKKKIFSPDKFVDIDFILNLLKENEFKCYYCKNNVKVLYKLVRESSQWSIERINNEFGHNKDNVTIACLDCNLKRKTMYHERFKFTKQLNIVKNDI